MRPDQGRSRGAPNHRFLRWAPVAAGAAVVAGIAGTARSQPPVVARVLARQSMVRVAVPTTSRAIAITLDDGPHARLTPEILAVLQRHGARATFFLLGSGVASNPTVAAAVADAGHEIGNHGWLDRPTVLLDRHTFRRDLRRTAAVILAASGQTPRFVRPGSGWFRPVHLREIRDAGCELALGSVAVLDLRVRDVDREARFVVDRLQPGAVVVLHEGRTDRAAVVPLLDRLLTSAQERGFRALTLSELVRDAGASAQGLSPRSSSRS